MTAKVVFQMVAGAQNREGAHPRREVRISTLCPHCAELCRWYRFPQKLVGICPNHGEVQELPVVSQPGARWLEF